MTATSARKAKKSPRGATKPSAIASGVNGRMIPMPTQTIVLAINSGPGRLDNGLPHDIRQAHRVITRRLDAGWPHAPAALPEAAQISHAGRRQASGMARIAI